jgi:hypothetical protein
MADDPTGGTTARLRIVHGVDKGDPDNPEKDPDPSDH